MICHVDQLLVGPMDNFMYLLVDPHTKSCFLVDPAWDSELIIKTIKNQQLELKGILLTHGHHDHVNALDDVLAFKSVPVYISKKESPALIPNVKEINLIDDDRVVHLGSHDILCIHTPGHTSGSMCFLIGHQLITGDTLFVNGCGRASFDSSNVHDLYKSLEKIKQLNDTIIIYPGHHYDELRFSSLGDQKDTNRFLKCKTEEEFVRKRINTGIL
jgi:hydroxyacylglutathione hydrolase